VTSKKENQSDDGLPLVEIFTPVYLLLGFSYDTTNKNHVDIFSLNFCLFWFYARLGLVYIKRRE
jgi:hypothetical protein